MSIDNRELRTLISRYFDGDLSAAELSQLEEILNSDPAAAEFYAELAWGHSDLVEKFTDLKIGFDQTDARQHAPAEVLPTKATQDTRSDSSSAGRRRSLFWNASIAVAASLLTFFAYQHFDPQPEPQTLGLPVVAKVVRKIDCDWENDGWAVRSTDDIYAGQRLTIARGLMELEFTSGAIVTLEGPVSFTVDSAMRGVMDQGKLAARVPESARGFTIVTPAGETIDLGTEFGVEVNENGITETHVFEGEVVMRPRNSAEVKLTDDMALKLDHRGDSLQRIDAAPRGFVQSSFDQSKTAATPAVDRDLVLWLAADGQLQLDEDGRVVALADITTRSNQRAENAWQVDAARRPTWSADSFNGRPTLEFTGSESLITEPLALGSNLTIAVVCRPSAATPVGSPATRALGRQIANLNGPPHLVLTVDGDQRLVSRSYLGLLARFDGEPQHVRSGTIVSSASVGGHTIAVVYIYDSKTKWSRLLLNGLEVDKIESMPLAPTISPRYVGKHSLHDGTEFIGEIAELMIYDTALNDDEVSELSDGMMEKYGIATAVAR